MTTFLKELNGQSSYLAGHTSLAACFSSAFACLCQYLGFADCKGQSYADTHLILASIEFNWLDDGVQWLPRHSLTGVS